jgi:hypothetical protein
MVACAVLDPSARLVAVIVTTDGDAGAVKVTAFPDVLVVGEKLPPPVDDQLTPLFELSLVKVALIERVCEAVRPPRFGVTVTAMLVPEEADVVAEEVFE